MWNFLTKTQKFEVCPNLEQLEVLAFERAHVKKLQKKLRQMDKNRRSRLRLWRKSQASHWLPIGGAQSGDQEDCIYPEKGRGSAGDWVSLFTGKNLPPGRDWGIQSFLCGSAWGAETEEQYPCDFSEKGWAVRQKKSATIHCCFFLNIILEKNVY